MYKYSDYVRGRNVALGILGFGIGFGAITTSIIFMSYNSRERMNRLERDLYYDRYPRIDNK